MTLVAGSVFLFSLVAIVALFMVKRYEVVRGSLVGGATREGADLFALRVKWVILVIEWYLTRLPDFLIVFIRLAIHSLALGFARLARASEAYAHQLADLVSHKRNFERRETKSDYLKQVGEHQMRTRTIDQDTSRQDREG